MHDERYTWEAGAMRGFWRLHVASARRYTWDGVAPVNRSQAVTSLDARTLPPTTDNVSGVEARPASLTRYKGAWYPMGTGGEC